VIETLERAGAGEAELELHRRRLDDYRKKVRG
jgi:hypothetical protein